MSWLSKLQAAGAEAVARDADPWRMPLERLRGQVGDDGVERITTQAVLDVLEIPQRSRRAGTYRRLARLMTELGWTAVRVRGMTRGGYMEQVRGFCRDTRHRPPSAPLERIPATQFEVTPEMIEAGTVALYRFDRHFEDEADAVSRIYRAMASSRF